MKEPREPTPDSTPVRWSLKTLLLATASVAVLLAIWRHLPVKESGRPPIEQIAFTGDQLIDDGVWTANFGSRSPVHLGSISPAAYSWRFLCRIEYCLCEYEFRISPDVHWNDPLYSSVSSARGSDGGNYFRLDKMILNREPHIFAVAGKNTAFEALWVSETPDRGALPGDLILLMDADLGDVHWMQPVDIEVEDHLPTDPSAKAKPLPPPATSRGRYVYFVDGVVWLLSKETPDAAITRFFTIGSAEEYDREEVLGRFRLDEFVSTGLGTY